MREVGIGPIGDTAEQRIATLLVKLIPADLGDAQRMLRIARVGHLIGKTAHVAGDNMQPLMLAHLFAAIKEQLHADADP